MRPNRDLRESEYLAVGERASQTLAQLAQICLFFGRESQALALIVCVDIVDIHDRGRSTDTLEVGRAQTRIYALQHRVVGRLGAGLDAGKLLDAYNAVDAHVLGDFNGIGAPGGYHFFAGAYERTGEGTRFQRGGAMQQPAEAFVVRCREFAGRLYQVDGVFALLEESDHDLLSIGYAAKVAKIRDISALSGV